MYYFIGIGGIGMSALAHFLLQKGVPVMGSDRQASAITQSLQAAGARIYTKQMSENVPNGAHVIYSTDIREDHPERVRALELGLKISHRSQLLAELMADYQPLMVAGVHGKTSTTGLLIHLLRVAGEDPAYIVGGLSPSFPNNGGYGKGRYFVAEADESDGSFLRGMPYGAIVTNVDPEHLNYWGNFDALIKGFKKFCAQPKELVYWGDDPHLSSFGLMGSPYYSAQIIDLQMCGPKLQMSYKIDGTFYENLTLNAIGSHQALNALAVMTLALKLGISFPMIQKAFSTFKGMKRRAEYLGESNDILYYDDYAHHPTEIKAIIKAFRQAFNERRLVVLFQPHRYSRFVSLYSDFCGAFNESHVLIGTDVYGAGESEIEGGTIEGLVAEAGCEGYYCAKNLLHDYLDSFLKPGDLLLTLGAGDITQIGRVRCVSESAPA